MHQLYTHRIYLQSAPPQPTPFLPELISKLFLYITAQFPGLRKIFWKSMYNFFAKKIRNRDWRFMNFGYAYAPGESCSMELDPKDETDRYSWQLYEHMLRIHPPTGDHHVLEVGSGRGGACYLVSQYYKPKKVTGIDLSDQAVDFCNSTYTADNLKYIAAPADDLPVPDRSVDIVMNAESSHAYPDFNAFCSEVMRVLRPGGYFMTTDNRKAELEEDWKEKLLNNGFLLVKEMDITSNVLASLDAQEARKEALIQTHVPKYFRKHFREFAGMKGSNMYEDFKNRRRVYKSFILEKPL